MYLLLAFVTGAPFVPSTSPTAKSMVDLAHLKKGQTIIDLGRGDGRILMLSASLGTRAIGLEMNPFLVLFSRIRAYVSPGRKNITVLWKNLWTADLRAANVVYIYLLPWRMNELAAKLKRECKVGTLVVSNSFIFPKWKIIRQDTAHHVYVYKI